MVIIENDRQMKVKSKGKVELKPDSPEIVVVGEGGSFELNIREGGKRRVFTVSRDAKGETRTYTEDGEAKPLDEATRGWLSRQVKEVQKNQTGTPEPPKHKIHVTVEEDGGRRIVKRIVIDSEKISRDVERHMKDFEKQKGELDRHQSRTERHKALILKEGDIDIPDMEF